MSVKDPLVDYKYRKKTLKKNFTIREFGKYKQHTNKNCLGPFVGTNLSKQDLTFENRDLFEYRPQFI